MKKANLLMQVLLACLLGWPAMTKAAPGETVTYGWRGQDWVNAKKTGGLTPWYPFKDTDERIAFRRGVSSGSYSFKDIKEINGNKCIACDYEEDSRIYVWVPGSSQSSVTVTGYMGIDDSYNKPFKGYFRARGCTVADTGITSAAPQQGEILATVADAGKINGETYTAETPVSLTVNDIVTDRWVEIDVKDFWLESVRVTTLEAYPFKAHVTVEGDAMPGVALQLLNPAGTSFHAVTGDDGNIEINPLPNGTYELTAFADPTYAAHRQSITVNLLQEMQTLNIDLGRLPAGKRAEVETYQESLYKTPQLAQRPIASMLVKSSGMDPYAKAEFEDSNADDMRMYGFSGHDRVLKFTQPNRSSKGDLVFTIVNVSPAGGSAEVCAEAISTSQAAARAVAFYKMTLNADGTFTRGELLKEYGSREISYDQWTRVCVDGLTENCFVGISGATVCVDNVQVIRNKPVAAGNTTALYDFGYLNNNAPFIIPNHTEIKDGWTLNYSSPNNGKENREDINVWFTGVNEDDYGFRGIALNKDRGYAANYFYGEGGGTLSFNLIPRSEGKTNSQYRQMNIFKAEKNDDGSFTLLYPVGVPVRGNWIQDTWEYIYPGEAHDITYTADIREDGRYVFSGYDMVLGSVTNCYNSEAMDLAGTLDFNGNATGGWTMTLQGPAGTFTADVAADGTYTAQGVKKGFYTLTATNGKWSHSTDVRVNDAQTALAMQLPAHAADWAQKAENFDWPVEYPQRGWVKLNDTDPAQTGWYSSDPSGVLVNAGVEGVKYSPAIEFYTQSSTATDPTLITYAYGCPDGAQISVDVAAWNNKPGNMPSDSQYGQLAIYKMLLQEDGTFERGDKLADLVTDHKIAGTEELLDFNYGFTNVSWKGLTEDCYIGFTGHCVKLDNYVNGWVQTPDREVTVTVADADMNLLPGATVTFTNGEQAVEATDAAGEGIYTAMLPAGDGRPKTWALSVTLDMFGDYTEEVEVSEDCNFDVILADIVRTFTATVADNGGNAVEGVVMTMDDGTDSVTLEAEEGVYTYATTMRQSTGKEYAVAVAAPGYKDAQYAFDFTQGDVTHAFAMEAWLPTTLAGTVTESLYGTPVADVTVTLTPEGGETIATTTDADGAYSFSFDGEVAPSYTLATSHRHFLAAESTHTLVRENAHTADVEVDHVMYTFTATVVDEATSLPLAGATVEVTDANEVKTEADNAGDGTYTFTTTAREAEDNTYSATAVHEGYEPSPAYDFAFADTDASHTFALKEVLGVQGVRIAAGISVKDGVLYVRTGAVVCDLAGRVVRRIPESGEAVPVTGLAPGWYLVNNAKVYLK